MEKIYVNDALAFARSKVSNILFCDDAQEFVNLCVGHIADSCQEAVRYYKNIGRFYHEPKPGDQVFFQANDIIHTGIVEVVSSCSLYTIEGNTSIDADLSYDGGMICRKSYDLQDSRILGYGRPEYDKPEMQIGLRSIADIQHFLAVRCDGEFNNETKEALIRYAQNLIGVASDGDFNFISLVAWQPVKRGANSKMAQIVQMALICRGYSCGPTGADGRFQQDSIEAVKRFQRDNNMVVTGVAGRAVAAKLFVR